jgi:hypothetical protein
MITLPIKNASWPQFRLLTRATWGGSVNSGGGWAIEKMEQEGAQAFGFILKNYSRALLPQIGTAEFIFRYGLFQSRIVGASSTSVNNMAAGNQWDPASDTLALPDLTGKEIRLQAAYVDSNGDILDSAWKTVWWGSCEYQMDTPWGASEIPSGEITYYCVDAIHRTKRWYLDRHGFIDSAGTIAPAAGHPGYNYSAKSPSQVAGNRDPSNGSWEIDSGEGVLGTKFVLPGAGNSWTDTEVINDILAIGRPSGQPHWSFTGVTDLFDDASPWPVQDGDTVFDLLTRIFARSRGRGAVYPTFGESSPTGKLTCFLIAYPQLPTDVEYNKPSSGVSEHIAGATSNATAVSVDLIGDHRLVSLSLGDAEQYRVDYLVTQGEQIEVMATVEHSLTLAPAWSTADEAAFVALDAEKRLDERWKYVFNLHRLKRGFKMLVGDGNDGPGVNCDYRCNDQGDIKTTGGYKGGTATSTVEVLDDLPLYEGYVLNGGVARNDGSTAAAAGGTPSRRGPLVLLYKSSDKYERIEQSELGVQFRLMPDGFLVTVSSDLESGTRSIGDKDVSSLGSFYNYEDLVMTLGFRLPHRVRLATGVESSPRKKIITINDIHLWLAAPNAIWDIDSANEDAGASPGRRNSGSNPIIIRDDRDALARIHALSVAWYGPFKNGTVHRNASWTLKCNGDIPSSADYDGGGVIYPPCGVVVTFLTANGQRYELNTPVSSIVYDNTNGTTTWTTDWQDLDLKHG